MTIPGKIMCRKVWMAALAASVMLGSSVAQAHIIEDIYTGNVNFSGVTFEAILEYNDQVGQTSPTEVTTGSEDPTLLAELTFSDGTRFNLPIGGAGSSSEYYVVPGSAIFSDYVDSAGDFFQIGASSALTPDTLDVAFTDSGASAFGGTAQIGGQFFDLPASSVEVVVDPTAAPEPSTWALMIVGAAGIGLAYRRRRKLSIA
jgi:type 1 fimbria pilin